MVTVPFPITSSESPGLPLSHQHALSFRLGLSSRTNPAHRRLPSRAVTLAATLSGFVLKS